MIFYELKISYTRQTGEDNPKAVKETYLVEGLTAADVEERLLGEIQKYISGEWETKSCKQVQFYDLIPNPEGDQWYKARVEMITIDGEKETRKNVSMLVQANTLDDAVYALRQALKSYDCELISIAKSPVMDILHAVH